MGAIRILLLKNCWTTGALLIALLLWVGMGPTLSTLSWSTSEPTEDGANSTSDVDGRDGDQEDRTVLNSLEAVVAPVAKLQMTLLGGFAPPRVVPETTVPELVSLSPPQNNYLRTLFRLIAPANAP